MQLTPCHIKLYKIGLYTLNFGVAGVSKYFIIFSKAQQNFSAANNTNMKYLSERKFESTSVCTCSFKQICFK